MTFNIFRTRRAAADSSSNSQAQRSESPVPSEHVPRAARTARETPLGALPSRRQRRESVAEAAARPSVWIGSAATATRSGANAGNTSPARARGRSSSPPANPSAGAGRTPAGPSGRRGQGFTGTYSSMDRVALHRFTYDQQRIAAQQTEQTRQRVRELNEFMASVRVASSQESTGTHNSTDHNALGIPTADQQRMATRQRVRELNEFMAFVNAMSSLHGPGHEFRGTSESTGSNTLNTPIGARDRRDIARGLANRQRMQESLDRTYFARTNESSRVPGREPTGPSGSTSGNTLDTPIGARDRRDIAQGLANRQRMQESLDRTYFARTNESSHVPSQTFTGSSESRGHDTFDTPTGDHQGIEQDLANRQHLQELHDLVHLARENDPSGMPSLAVLTDALGMLTGMHETTDLTGVVGTNAFYLIEHLRDIGVLPSYQLASPVQQAARGAHNDPERLVRNLLALVTADSPVLPTRAHSSS